MPQPPHIAFTSSLKIDRSEGPVLSLHTMIDGDRFRWERGAWDQGIVRDLKTARAVILPQTVQRELYTLCRKLCPNVFPNYDLRFQWEGKVGDTLLFWTYGVPHPSTLVFPRVEALQGEHTAIHYTPPPLPAFPFILKAAQGGEGRNVWLIEHQGDLDRILNQLRRSEWQGIFGFVVQEFLPDLDRDLRVVAIGDKIVSYWRQRSGDFRHNVAQGGEIDKDSDPELQAAGRKAVADLCDRTGINLAGFDLLFLPGNQEPLFLEINYTFGRAGLGGSEAFDDMMRQAVDRWLKKIC